MIDTAVVRQRWQELARFTQQNFSEPDLQALEIALCAYRAHYFGQDLPAWLQILGPPSTGKTRIAMSALSCLPETYSIDDFGKTALLSGYRGGRKTSILNRIQSGIMLFKDFATILSMRHEARDELVATLRRVHDGEYNRAVGSRTQGLEWTGKITVISACTPALERAWSVVRELGDRFLTVRWSRGNGIESASAAIRNSGREKSVVQGFQQRVKDFMDPTGLQDAAAPAEADCQALCHMAELVARLRTPVIWQNGQIEHIDEPEGTPRLAQGVLLFARARAVIYRRLQATVEDLQAVQRTIWDAVPLSRRLVYEAIPPGASTNWGDLINLTGMSDGSLDRNIDTLIALRVLQRTQTGLVPTYSFTPAIEQLQAKAFPRQVVP